MKYDIMGVLVNNVTMDEAVSEVASYLDVRKNRIVVTPNAEILQMCVEDPSVMAAVRSADFVVPDGVGVIYAARLLKTPLKEKVAGVDLAWRLLKTAADSGKSVYFFGAKPGIAEKAAKNAVKAYPKLKIVGTRNGYFTDDELPDIIKDINQSGAALLYVCLGAPKQEKWMADNRDKLNVSVMLGLGGSLNIFAGAAKRAPQWMIRMRLEWLHRLIKEPWRFGRMMRLPLFLMSVKKEYRRRKKQEK